MTHVTYVGMGRTKDKKGKSSLYFNDLSGCLYIRYTSWPHISIRTDKEKAERILEILKDDERFKECQPSFYDHNKNAVWIFIPFGLEKEFKKFIEDKKIKSYFCDPNYNTLLGYGLNPVDEVEETVIDSLEWTPLRYRRVEFDKELEEELKKGDVVRDSLEGIKVGDLIDFESVKKGVLAFLDIEATRYREGDDSINGVGLIIYDGSECIIRKILNRWGFSGIVSYEGVTWDVQNCESEEVIVKSLENLINEYDVSDIFSYGDYDVMHPLRRIKDKKSGVKGFNIGKDGKNPRIVGGTDQKRVEIAGREHINLYELMKRFMAFSPDKSFDACLRRFSAPLEFKWGGKTKSHEELGSSSPEELVEYLIKDVSSLEKLILSKNSMFMEIMFNAAMAFGVSRTRICFGSDLAGNKRKEGSLKSQGSYKDDVAWVVRDENGKTMSIKQKAIKDYKEGKTKFKENILNLKNYKIGCFNGVSRVYIPLGVFVKDLLVKRFHSIVPLLGNYRELAGSCFSLGVSRYIEDATLKVFMDYFFYEQKREEYKQLIGNYNLKSSELGTSLFMNKIELFYDHYKLGWGFKRKIKIVNEYLAGRDYYEKLVSVNRLRNEEIINLIDNEYKFISVYKGFAGTHGFSVEDFETYLRDNVKRLNEILRELEVVNFNGDMIYVIGDTKELVESGLGIIILENLNLISYGRREVAYLFDRRVVGCGISRIKGGVLEDAEGIFYYFMKTFLSGDVEGSFKWLNGTMKSCSEEVRKKLFGVSERSDQLDLSDQLNLFENVDNVEIDKGVKINKGRIGKVLVNVVNDSRVSEELGKLAIGKGNLDYFCEMFGFRL